MNKRKNLCILFSLILAFFFVGCSDFYQDMSGSSIEMSFKVPEKIDERVIVSRSTSITDIVTYKLVVKLESKNEVLDKIEKKVCSGELVTLAFTNVKKGKTVKVSAQLFQEEECVYIGESDWINTSKGKNYVKVMLDTTEEPIVPEILIHPEGKITLYTENSESLTLALTCSSLVNIQQYDNPQNLTMQWQEKIDSKWIDYQDTNINTQISDGIAGTSSFPISLAKNEVRTFRCVISNYIITPAGKKKTVTLYSNEATIAYIEGKLDSISAEYIGEYELYGVEVQKENFKVFANYKVWDSIQSLPVNDFNVKNENSSCIGNVPHSITYPTTAPTGISTTIPVPVKYQLNADKLAITALVDGTENTQETDSGTRLKIAQYTQNVQLSAKYNDTVYLYNGETYNPSPINILDICNINWASYSGGPSIGNSNTLTIQDESKELSQGLATYECTITPNTNSEFIVGESVTKQYFVNVCPWKIALTKYQNTTPDGFDNKTLEGGVTYFPKLTNEADGATSSDVTYSVYGEGYSINSLNVIQAPTASTNEQKATIKASWNDKEIASLDVVVPAEENSGTSGGTTGGGTSTYQIGDVYSENGKAMGVVFEVAEDNSYIKIVALNESSDNLMFAKSGYLQTSDSDFFLFDDDGYGNFDGLYYQVLSEKIEGIENYPAFDYCYSYYVNDYDNELWVLPAIEELIAIVQTNINVINQTLNNGNYTQISTSFGYWSSTMVEGTTKAYYCTSLGGKQSYNVTTSCGVRPILRIDFED